MEQQLPFQLPPEAENFFDGNSQGSSFDLSIGDLMEKNYQNVEYQSLLTLHAMEKEQAKKQGKLKMFPKEFSHWQPAEKEVQASTLSQS